MCVTKLSEKLDHPARQTERAELWPACSLNPLLSHRDAAGGATPHQGPTAGHRERLSGRYTKGVSQRTQHITHFLTPSVLIHLKTPPACPQPGSQRKAGERPGGLRAGSEGGM